MEELQIQPRRLQAIVIGIGVFLLVVVVIVVTLTAQSNNANNSASSSSSTYLSAKQLNDKNIAAVQSSIKKAATDQAAANNSFKNKYTPIKVTN